MTTAVELRGIGKRYMQLQEQAMLLRSLLPFAKRTRTERWALKDVDFTIDEGETVGILGRNGAGKTTLLRLLAGVSQPSEGSLRISGRIAPLISIGVGFHQEMSGRENIYVNGMLLGLTKAEVTARFDEILAFAELEDFIDTPVKFYSSGMFMRLGFSVASHVDPQVMLVDEVLAVGDMGFQLKCLERMRTLQQQGTTILLVSHSMHAIRLLCPRALLFRKGSLEFDGSTEAAISRHHELMSIDNVTKNGETASTVLDPVTILDRQLLGPEGPTNHPHQDDPLTYKVRVRFNETITSPQIFFQVVTEVGTLAYSMQSDLGATWHDFAAGDESEIVIRFQPRLGGGTYQIVMVFTSQDSSRRLFADPAGVLMYLAPRLGSLGTADLEAAIDVDERPLTNHKDLLIGSRKRPNERLDAP